MGVRQALADRISDKCRIFRLMVRGKTWNRVFGAHSQAGVVSGSADEHRPVVEWIVKASADADRSAPAPARQKRRGAGHQKPDRTRFRD